MAAPEVAPFPDEIFRGVPFLYVAVDSVSGDRTEDIRRFVPEFAQNMPGLRGYGGPQVAQNTLIRVYLYNPLLGIVVSTV